MLDANLLVLLIVGLVDRELIPKHKRTKSFEQPDFDLLAQILSNFDVVVTTPHILTEASNLVSQIGEPSLSMVRQEFAKFIQEQQEIYVASKDSALHPAFARFGLTDASILQLAAPEVFLLTTDAKLYVEALNSNLLAENFNYLRQPRLLGG